MALSESNFHRPTEFLPDRYLPADSRPGEFAGDRRGTQKPFGLGDRNCIGRLYALAEMRVVLARLVWHFDLAAAPGARLVDWNRLKTYVLVEKEPIMVQARPRRM